jgi:hypothetical protein
VADAASRTESRVFCDDRAQELVGVQAALHQDFGLPFANEGDSGCRRGMAVRRIDDLDAPEIQTVLRGNLADFRRRADQNRRDQPVFGRLERRAG